ncbi:hypothetical protein EN45_062730 [Penicillium chrysogenum]|uniref:Thioredoxin-like fold domain-containing protein n=1 Tax=Penicillium chrysogenum TaxID=5076 RepID=A0A167SZB5_PENCH|nr:hypothetical protein EN45_062730 [Penicillium chrysogenum]
MFNTFYANGPTVAQQYSSRLQVIFRQQIQPWRLSSTLTHEAGAAVLRLAPEKFWQFSAALFQNQAEFFDVSVVNETRNKTYERLAKIAGSIGVDVHEVLALLVIPETSNSPDELNAGNQLANDMKWMTKANRVVGVHVTPTIFFNGVEERGISSSFKLCHLYSSVVKRCPTGAPESDPFITSRSINIYPASKLRSSTTALKQHLQQTYKLFQDGHSGC